MINNLRQIAIFATTIDHGSFRAAAKALKLSPSVISSQISDLEANLGVALIYRSTRSISLTKDGEDLLRSARIMMEAAESGIQSITAKASEPSGELKITLPAVLAHSQIIGQLSTFSKLYSNIQLTIDFSDTQKNLIKDGYDLSIRMGWLKDSALISKKLKDEKRILVASTEYVNSKPIPETPKDLSDWNWLELSAVKGIKHKFQHKTYGTKTVKPKSALAINDAFALYQFSKSGNGLASVPEFLAREDIKTGKMSQVLSEWQLDSLGIYAVWPQNAPKHGLTKILIEHLAS